MSYGISPLGRRQFEDVDLPRTLYFPPLGTFVGVCGSAGQDLNIWEGKKSRGLNPDGAFTLWMRKGHQQEEDTTGPGCYPAVSRQAAGSTRPSLKWSLKTVDVLWTEGHQLSL